MPGRHDTYADLIVAQHRALADAEVRYLADRDTARHFDQSPVDLAERCLTGAHRSGDRHQPNLAALREEHSHRGGPARRHPRPRGPPAPRPHTWTPPTTGPNAASLQQLFEHLWSAALEVIGHTRQRRRVGMRSSHGG
ncbi:hypothetical protein [Amycolatopsis sp. MtRt-6]|uniref:hypothetical protein n=1 Tax=Amycolatopsis sp. MtRt-6 TaxID=2792782 RepID=UPI001A8E1712|nr:hypothetical protein [Amycolatopsis sp. MtRt-6]